MAGWPAWNDHGICEFIILIDKNLLDVKQDGWYTISRIKNISQGAVAKW